MIESGAMNRLGLVLIILAILVAVAGGAYYWWTTTPLWAFQEAGLAVVGHDTVKFRKVVDLEPLIESALNDLFFGPLEKIPGLTDQKRQVLCEALKLMKKPVRTALIRQVEDYVGGKPGSTPGDKLHNGSTPGDQSTTGSPPAAAETTLPAQSLKTRFTTLVHKKVLDLKEASRRKLEEYAEAHPQSLEGRILNLPRDERQTALKELLSEYGFTPGNFKGIAYSRETAPGTCLVGAGFYSPRVNRDLLVEIELRKTGGKNENWRISRFANLGTLISTLEPGYENDLQQLALFAASEIKNAVSAKVQNTREKIKERLTGRLDKIKQELQERAAARGAQNQNPTPANLSEKLDLLKQKLKEHAEARRNTASPTDMNSNSPRSIFSRWRHSTQTKQN
jgi:hypothetical protein